MPSSRIRPTTGMLNRYINRATEARKNRGLAFKLSICIISAASVVLIFILLYQYSTSRDIILNGASENAHNLALSTIYRIQEVLSSVAKVPSNVAYVYESTSSSEDELKSFLHSIVANNDEIYGSCMAFEPYTFFENSYSYAPYFYKSGDEILYENLGSETYNYFDWDWYQIPKELERPVWSEPYYDEGGGNIIMSTYSVPFYRRESGERLLHGILTSDISLHWLQELVSSIEIFESGYGFLISRNGTIVTHPQENLIMNESIFSMAEELDYPGLRDIGRAMIHGESGFVRLTGIVFHDRGWLYYAPVTVSGWSLGIVIPEDELYADLRDLSTDLLFIGTIGLLALLVVIVLISRGITRPLSRLAAVTQDIGSGNFNVELPPARSGDEIGKLSGSFGSMQAQLKEYIANLKETTAAKERIESELDIAREIQMSMIPKTFPAFPNKGQIDLYASIEPAKAVGGDFYDFFFLDDTHLCFAIGDVSGKGVPAALFMAVTRTLLRSKVQQSGLTVEQIVASMNKDLVSDNEKNLYVTFFLCILDITSGELEYCNAGHNYPYYHRKSGGMEQLAKTHTVPLGTFDVEPDGADKVILEPGEEVILYTDGLNEAMNADDELYEDVLLDDCLAKLNTESAEQTVLTILKDVEDFTRGAEQSDDLTIAALRYLGEM